MIESPDIIERLRVLIEQGSGIFAVFDRTLVNRSRAMELVDMLAESLPEELRQAMEIIEKRDDIIEDAKQKAGEIVDEAVRRAERLVDADSIMVEARRRAVDIQANTDEYVAEKLGMLEEELVKLLAEVRGGISAVSSGIQKPE